MCFYIQIQVLDLIGKMKEKYHPALMKPFEDIGAAMANNRVVADAHKVAAALGVKGAAQGVCKLVTALIGEWIGVRD